MAGRGGARPGSGRPKGHGLRANRVQKATLGELARKYTDVAMRALSEVASKGESESARVAASVALLDRGYGKPPQAIQHTGAVGSYDLTKVKNDDLDRLETILRAASVTGGSAGGEGEEGGG
jgi:hypothetical protein